MTVDLAALEIALDVELADRGLLELALIHRSYAFEAGGLPTNERLEFLGDAVLGLVVTDRIYHRYPEASEGRLAKVRATAVSTQSLAKVARRLGLGEQVRLGKGEEQSGGRDKDSILADTMEAVIGAVYLDRGTDAAAGLVLRLFGGLLDDIGNRRESLDYKTSLQELTAAALATLPAYHLTETGPDHAKRFTAVATVGGEALGRGRGRSKKEAEQQAAAEAYESLHRRLAGRPGWPEAVGSPAREPEATPAPPGDHGAHRSGGRPAGEPVDGARAGDEDGGGR